MSHIKNGHQLCELWHYHDRNTNIHTHCMQPFLHTHSTSVKMLSPKPKHSCNRHAINYKPLSTITCGTVQLKTFAAYLYMVY